MPTEPAYLLHAVAGSIAIILYWATIAQRKGSGPHRRYGKMFLIVLAAVILTVGGIFFLSSRVFAAPEIVQFVYLSLCVYAVGTTAYTAIGLKDRLEAFRGLRFKLTGIAAFAMALVVLAAGIATANPLPMIFSVIGLSYGGAMIRFAFMRAEAHPRWSLIWHLNGMCFLFDAIHGTIFAVAWRAYVDPTVGDGFSTLVHVGTMGIALAMRLWFGRRFNAPLRLSAERAVAYA